MTWEHGRQLSALTKDGGSISYTYNADGMRTSKTVNGQTTEYILDGSTILGEKLPDGEYLYYLFDENGVRYGFARGVTLYYYVCNAQGDVIKILTSGGATAAWYEYDAWGNVVSVGGNADIANLNPIRYRGYYYDAETGFYYLNSRYYDPEICRFVNADGYVSTGQGLLGNNMFAYCLNNPVSYIDPDGEAIAGAVSGGLIALAEIVLPALAIVGGVVAIVVGVGAIINEVSHPSISIPKEREDATTKTKKISGDTPIYRYGGTNPGILTPRKNRDETTGLSFSTIPRSGAAMTTINALNSTGIVYVVQDDPTHISVKPVGASVPDWISAGRDSIWTQAVKSVVIKWDVRKHDEIN